MRQHILAAALAATVSTLAIGQNLHPTVEVTNAYEGGASSIVKPQQKMAVPDSVMAFNLDFDYSVFEKPYQGAYEFKPYHVQLKPRPNPSTENAFYLRAGAGYTFHPDFDLAWSPVRKEKFQLGVHASHHSYFGRYHLQDPADEEGIRVFRKTGEKMSGYRMDTRVGVNGGYGWDGGSAILDVAYRHQGAEDSYLQQKAGGVEVQGRVRSFPSDEPHFLYDAAIDYHFLNGGYLKTLPVITPSSQGWSESHFVLDGSFGPVFSADRRLLVDLDVTLARYGKDLAGYTGGLSVTPKYEFSLDDWRFSLGLRLASLIYSDNWAYEKPKSGFIFPAVKVDYRLLDDRLILQASATGGDRVQAWSDLMDRRPFVPFADFTHSLERIRAMLGARGNISSRFRYDLQAGYARWSRAPLDGFRLSDGIYQPAVYDAAFHLLFAELDYGWKSGQVSVDGKMAYRWTDVAEECVFAPAAFSGKLVPAYHWGERFKAGMDLSWATSRRTAYRGSDYVLPGWLDFGLFAEYMPTHHFGLWLKGGNLLNQTIQRMPLRAEAGICLTAGVLLTF